MSPEVLIVFLSVLIAKFFFLFYKFISLQNIAYLCQLESRHLIFGEEFCGEVFRGNVIVTSDFLNLFINSFSSKVVLDATYNKTPVILKTLTSQDVFVRLEHDIIKTFPDRTLTSEEKVDFLKFQIHSSIVLKPGTVFNPTFRLCPFSSKIDNLLRRLNSKTFSIPAFINLWTVVNTNPEPLILKLLQPPEWNVPKLYGACGRMITVENCGETLTSFYDRSWEERAKLSKQIIQMALDFTNRDPEFGFYFTDLNPDNFVVSAGSVVRLIDLENVIMVDRATEIEAGEWQTWASNHTSKHVPCTDCIVFESDEICQHSISDHNVYAVCKEILADSSVLPGGLLHDRPSSPHLDIIEDLISECIQPTSSSRFSVAHQLIQALSSN